MNKMLTICDEFAIGYNAISSELTNNSDKSEKRTAFISQANNVSCYFAKLNLFIYLNASSDKIKH